MYTWNDPGEIIFNYGFFPDEPDSEKMFGEKAESGSGLAFVKVSWTFPQTQ